MSTAPDQAVFSPMLQQYLDYKKSYQDCFIFMQVGDFYELFFQDAVDVSRLLNLTLTSRDKSAINPIPMCGVPIAVIENYLERIVEAGHSAAIVSQVPTNGSTKAGVDRFLERIITPGVRILANSDGAGAESIVASVYLRAEDDASLAFMDARSGTVAVRDSLSFPALFAEIARLSPSELVLPSSVGTQKLDRRIRWISELEGLMAQGSVRYRTEPNLSVDKDDRSYSDINGYTALSDNAKRSVRLLVGYIDEITVERRIPVREISQKNYDSVVTIDSMTRRNLEIVKNSRNGTSEGTLFAILNRTQTSGGTRLLKDWILNPLNARKAIERRLDCVSELINQHSRRTELSNELKFVADLERLAARLELLVVLPRELGALRDSLERARPILKILQSFEAELFSEMSVELHVPDALLKPLREILAESPEYSLHQGNIIRDGYNAELDRLRGIRNSGRAWMSELESRERHRTGISSLKIKFNNVLGYFIEVTSANSSKVPADYIRRQSTANTERFTTPELREREAEVVTAESKQWALEKQIFEKLRIELVEFAAVIRAVAQVLSKLDVLISFAEVSDAENFNRPALTEGCELKIEKGRHPVLAQILRDSFVPTSLDLTEKEYAVILTGPNMGGKSTYLRQAALIAIMAQAGCFVPAAEARVGIVDKVFARIGASDNLAEGDSTFMVEMREASFILSNASSRSLILIDEIGRGTATADGLAIAQAILEWISAATKCRLLFATHFHELTKLEGVLPGIVNLSVASHDREGKVVFTHEICRGPADRSYGLEVAELAGLPVKLLERAQELLSLQTTNENQSSATRRQLTMFSDVPKKVPTVDSRESEFLKKLSKTAVNEMTPLEALIELERLTRESAGYVKN